MSDVLAAKQFNMTYGPSLKSSENEIRRYGKSNAAKGQDLFINNSKAKNAVRIFRDSVIGKRLRLQLQPRWRLLGVDQTEGDEAAEQFEDLFDNWANSITFDSDVRRKQNLTSLFGTLTDTKFMSGNAYAISEWQKGQMGHYTCLNMIDPARICNPKGKSNSKTLQNGIELNKFGAPIAYYVRSGHPNDFMHAGAVTWKRIPKYTKHGRPLMLHSFEANRPEQNSGISNFSATAKDINNLSNYNAAEQDRARLQSMFGAYIKSVLDYEDAVKIAGADVGTEGNLLNKINDAAVKATSEYYKSIPDIGGAKLLHLLPNEELGLIESGQSVDAFEAFNMIANREISAGFGVDVHNMSRNYKDVSYSAARAAQEDAYRGYLVSRQQIIEDFGMPLVSCFMEEVIDSGLWILPKGVDSFYKNKQALCTGTFMGEGKPNIDPVKTAKAFEITYKLGGMSMSEFCAGRGVDVRDLYADFAREKKWRENLGLKPEDLNPELLFNLNSETSKQAANKKDDNEDEDDEK